MELGLVAFGKWCGFSGCLPPWRTKFWRLTVWFDCSKSRWSHQIWSSCCQTFNDLNKHQKFLNEWRKFYHFLPLKCICKINQSSICYAHAKMKKWFCPVRFPGNCFNFEIISNDFWSSTIWAYQIQLWFQTQSSKILKIPEFNLGILFTY